MKGMALILLATALFTAGCVSTYGGGSPDGVKIYTSTYSNSQDSFDKAKTHCFQFERDAEFVRSSRFPSYDEFKCVDKEEK